MLSPCRIFVGSQEVEKTRSLAQELRKDPWVKLVVGYGPMGHGQLSRCFGDGNCVGNPLNGAILENVWENPLAWFVY